MSTTLTNNGTAIVSPIVVGKSVSIKAKTNSNFTQRVTVTDGNQQIALFTGSGGGNTIIGQTAATISSGITAKFEYSPMANAWSSSALNTGGPYSIGSYNLLVVVAENGDDSDYNDCILEVSWSSK